MAGRRARIETLEAATDALADAVADGVDRLDDLIATLEGSLEGVRLRTKADQALLVDSIRRLMDLRTTLAREYDRSAPNPDYLVAQSGVSKVILSTLFATAAFVQVSSGLPDAVENVRDAFDRIVAAAEAVVIHEGHKSPAVVHPPPASSIDSGAPVPHELAAEARDRIVEDARRLYQHAYIISDTFGAASAEEDLRALHAKHPWLRDVAGAGLPIDLGPSGIQSVRRALETHEGDGREAQKPDRLRTELKRRVRDHLAEEDRLDLSEVGHFASDIDGILHAAMLELNLSYEDVTEDDLRSLAQRILANGGWEPAIEI